MKRGGKKEPRRMWKREGKGRANKARQKMRLNLPPVERKRVRRKEPARVLFLLPRLIYRLKVSPISGEAGRIVLQRGASLFAHCMQYFARYRAALWTLFFLSFALTG